MKKRLYTLFMLMLMVLSSFFFAFKPAVAQTGTTVFFSPDPANVYLNDTNSQVVAVTVNDAVNLWGFEYIITYDTNLATVAIFAMGNLLNIDMNTWCLVKTNSPGYFRLQCNLNAPAEPVTGSGVLFTMTFTGKQNGDTPLVFNKSAFVIREGENLSYFYPPSTNGTLSVTYDPAIIKPTTLSGSLDLQGRVDQGGIPVTLSEAQFVGQGPYTVPTTNVSGSNLSFPSVAMDVYTVSTNQARYLNITPEMGRQIALLASGNVLPPLRLLGGNAIWTNNEIDVFDVALVSGEIGKTTFIADADINNDGKVDIFDLALVAGNFGMTSAIAYAGWLQ